MSDVKLQPPDETSTAPETSFSTHSHGIRGHMGHVVSVKMLVGVLVGLLILTWITVAATFVDLGGLNIVIALVIATMKASLVCLFFMHLFWDRRFNLVVLVASLCFLSIFIGFCLMDRLEYLPLLDEVDGPGVELRLGGSHPGG